MTKEELAKAMVEVASRYTHEDVDSDIVKDNIILYIYQINYMFFYNVQGKLYKVWYSNWVETLTWIKQIKDVIDANGNIDFKNSNRNLILSIYSGAYWTKHNLDDEANDIEDLSDQFKNSEYSEELKEHIRLLDSYAKKLRALKENRQLIDLSEKVVREFNEYEDKHK